MIGGAVAATLESSGREFRRRRFRRRKIMGLLGDFGRLINAAGAVPRPSLSQSMALAADSVERIPEYQAMAAAVQSGYGAATADPLANMAAMQNGARGSATVVSMNATAQKVDAATVYEVGMRVTDAAGESWDVVHRQLIAPAALGNWKPGAVFPVRYNDRTSVLIG
jgi:hypothetical protein